MRQNVFKRKGGRRREGGGGRKNRVEPLARSSIFFFLLSSKGLSKAFEKLRELTVSVDEAPSSGKALSHDETCCSRCKKKKNTHGPHEAVCTHISRKKGERRKQTEIRGRRREQMLKQMQEGALR